MHSEDRTRARLMVMVSGATVLTFGVISTMTSQARVHQPVVWAAPDRDLPGHAPTSGGQNQEGAGKAGRSVAQPMSPSVPRSFAAGAGRLAFSAERNGNTDIFAINADGTDLQRLTTDPADDFDPTWSPDGRRIAFRSRGTGPGASDQIYLINADGSDRVNLTRNAAENWSPAWSPDGSKIAFASSLGGGVMNVHVMNLDGTDLRRLTQAEGEYPSWSRDGKRIAYASSVGPSASDYEIWTMNADGTHQRQLTHNHVDDSSPTWSPDGRHIAFDSQRRGRIAEPGIGPEFEIYVTKANGSRQRALTRNHKEDRFPSWSADGRRIAWTQDGTIMLMDADGTHQAPLTDDQGPVHGQFPDWQPTR